jgi:hypothetical protein
MRLALALRRPLCAAPLMMHAIAGAAQAQGSGSALGPLRFLVMPSDTLRSAVVVDPTLVPRLNQHIAVQFDGVARALALKEISRLSGLDFVYALDAVPPDTPVRLNAAGITVAAALTAILRDTDVDLLLKPGGNAVLVQRSVLEGAVNSDSLGKHGVPGADVSIPALKLSAQANFVGEFRLRGVAPGRYLVIASGAGLRSVGDTVTITGGGTAYHDFVLATKAVVLDSVVSKAPSQREYISPALNAFEERRRSHSGGYFITDSVLRQEEDRPLWEVISKHVPGANMVFGRTGAVYLASSRGPSTNALHGGSTTCYPDVYLDGVPLAPASPTARSGAKVSLSFPTTEIGAVEFFAGGATLPAEFSHSSSGCGALLLWTRER